MRHALTNAVPEKFQLNTIQRITETVTLLTLVLLCFVSIKHYPTNN